MGVKKILILLTLLLSTLTNAQHITGIETSISIDKYILFPYNSLTLYHKNGLNIEAGFVDYPTSTNVFFQETIRQQSTNLQWIIPTIEDYGDYSRNTRGTVPYYFIGYRIEQDIFAINIQNGWCHDNYYTLKLKPYIRIYEYKENNSKVQFHINSQVFISEKSTYTFIGYNMLLGI